MSPTAIQPLSTRATKSRGFKREDQGYGWGRICTEPGCDTRINHLHQGDYCYACELRQEEEERQAA